MQRLLMGLAFVVGLTLTGLAQGQTTYEGADESQQTEPAPTPETPTTLRVVRGGS